ncbi:hypothetical protein GCM10023091_13620 [Ravibacter arvi]|uniref:Uncharacterized protein n=1 Tax=Ravibacter arvi TaxID=2051041 RepID=A0ABP8LUE0_9BACT
MKDNRAYSYIEIIGREKCHIDPLKNAWLIDLKSGDKIGIEIMIEGVTYKNVVKTDYDLENAYRDSSMKYSISYISQVTYTVDCDLSPGNVSPSESNKIPVLEIISLSFSGV